MVMLLLNSNYNMFMDVSRQVGNCGMLCQMKTGSCICALTFISTNIFINFFYLCFVFGEAYRSLTVSWRAMVYSLFFFWLFLSSDK